MKKNTGRKNSAATAQIKPDVAGLIIAVQHQLASLDRKIDLLISKSSGLPPAAQHSVKTFHPVAQPQVSQHAAAQPQTQPQPQAQSRVEVKQESRFRERVLHKAVCADCKKACEVPFKPSGYRPVYCKDCFSKRKKSTPFNAKPDNRPIGDVVHHASQPEKKYTPPVMKAVARKRPAARPAVRKKKKRA